VFRSDTFIRQEEWLTSLIGELRAPTTSGIELWVKQNAKSITDPLCLARLRRVTGIRDRLCRGGAFVESREGDDLS